MIRKYTMQDGSYVEEHPTGYAPGDPYIVYSPKWVVTGGEDSQAMELALALKTEWEFTIQRVKDQFKKTIQ